MYVTSVISESKLLLIRGGKGVVEGKWGLGGGEGGSLLRLSVSLIS